MAKKTYRKVDKKRTKTKKMRGGSTNGFTLVGFILPSESLYNTMNPFQIGNTGNSRDTKFMPIAGMTPIFIPDYFRYYGDMYNMTNEIIFRRAFISGKPTILYLTNLYNLGIRGIDMFELIQNNIFFIDDNWKGTNLLFDFKSYFPREIPSKNDTYHYNKFIEKVTNSIPAKRAILSIEMAYPGLFKRVFVDDNYKPETNENLAEKIKNDATAYINAEKNAIEKEQRIQTEQRVKTLNDLMSSR